LETSELWRDVVTEVGHNYPDITLKHMYVDNCAMQLIRNPAQFDVIVTSNLFGDILSDEAAMLTGSIGMLPSASLGEKTALYEPIHGSAPDIAGKNIANPMATILSVALMLRYSFSMPREADLIEKAVAETLKEGFRTQDIHQQNKKLVGTGEMGDNVARNLCKLLNSRESYKSLLEETPVRMKKKGSAVFLEKISIDPPLEKIYQRLGYKKRTTEISAKQKEETDRFINEAFSFISLKGVFLRLTINHNDGEKIILTGNLTFNSKKLSAFLRGCKEAVLMGATASNAIMEAIKGKTRQDDLAAAVVYDATASEVTDAAMDWIMDYFNQLIRREGKTLLPKRFSAGYADFNLENQKAIYEMLQMEKLGVKITSNFILLPEKSVTAISGIRG